jgi:hypothetical protein
MDWTTLRASHAIVLAALALQPVLWVGIIVLGILAHRLTQLRHELERHRWHRVDER